MRFLTHGDKSNKSILLIHGMANTSDLFDPLLPYLKDYYVIVCELDGHSAKEQGTFISVKDAAGKIERYVKDNFDGRLYGLLGFSLGGTIATELISRGNIEVERTVLDAALSCYKYDVKDGIRDYKNPVVYWRGENEPYPVKSARLLRKYLSQMKVRVFKGMGHGQMLHEHTGVYAKRLLSFLEEE